MGHFCPPGSGSAIWMRIRIQQLKLMRIHADPDPKPWWPYSIYLGGRGLLPARVELVFRLWREDEVFSPGFGAGDVDFLVRSWQKTKQFKLLHYKTIDNKYWSLFYHITGNSSNQYCGFGSGGAVINLPPGSGYGSMVLLSRIRFRIWFLTSYQDLKKLRKNFNIF